MKNTVFTVMTVLLLMATLCLPATAQTWQQINSYSPAIDADERIPRIWDIAFRDNLTVFFSKGAHLFKWITPTGRAWELDFGDDSNAVFNIAIPRHNGSVVIFAYAPRAFHSRLQIRRTDDLSYIDESGVFDGHPTDLRVDDNGNYVVGRTNGSLWAGRFNQRFTYDLWGSDGWQLRQYEFTRDNVAAAAIHPELQGGHPYTYFSYWNDPDLIRERAGRSWGDSYITGFASDDQVWTIAVDQFRGNTRVVGLLRSDIIDVWDWSGNRQFAFNADGGRSKNLRSHILEFTPNGELLATVTNRDVIFWDMSTRREHPSSFTTNLPSSTVISALAISDNGKRLAVGSEAGRVYIYEWTGDSAPVAPAKETETQPTALLENYPNPFNPETWIPYQLSAAAEVTVTIHSPDGKLVRTLELGQMPAGAYSDKDRAAYWDGRNAQGEPVASGVYFYTLTAGDFSATRKMVIRK